MSTQETIKVDLQKLNSYLGSIPYGEQAKFVKRVCEACHVPRKYFYNWKAGLCRIPDPCKEEMENVAGCTFFHES